MKMDQLNGLVALKAVADAKNFGSAAEKLGVSASAVSQSIKLLEKRLGVALLSRTTRSTSLTEAGTRFLNQAGPALDQILTALDDTGSYGKAPSGLLRLNLPRHVYTAHLAPIISSFIKKHPEITVELFFEEQRADIVKGGFDAGIRLSDILAQDVSAIKLFGPLRFVTVASPAYLARSGTPKHPKDLLNHNCVRHAYNTGLYDNWEFEQKGKGFEVKVTGSVIMNDPIMVEDAALKGMGIIYTLEQGIKHRLDSGELEIVLGQYSITSTGFYLYYPKPSQALPKLRVFIDHLKRAQGRNNFTT